MASEKKKKNFMAEEIGQLRAALANRDKSIAHYRTLVGEHSKTLHRQTREIKRLGRAKSELAERLASSECVIRQASLDTFGEELSTKEFADRSGYDS
jgi:chromosome segregation ATPase